MGATSRLLPVRVVICAVVDGDSAIFDWAELPRNGVVAAYNLVGLGIDACGDSVDSRTLFLVSAALRKYVDGGVLRRWQVRIAFEVSCHGAQSGDKPASLVGVSVVSHVSSRPFRCWNLSLATKVGSAEALTNKTM
jgi:hypothetical protein